MSINYGEFTVGNGWSCDVEKYKDGTIFRYSNKVGLVRYAATLANGARKMVRSERAAKLYITRGLAK